MIKKLGEKKDKVGCRLLPVICVTAENTQAEQVSCFGRILIHLPYSFRSLVFEGIPTGTSPLKSSFSISGDLSLDHDLAVPEPRLVPWANFSPALAARQMASHFPIEYYRIKRIFLGSTDFHWLPFHDTFITHTTYLE